MEKVDDFLFGILKQRFASETDGTSSNAAAAAGNFLLKSEENIISFLNTPDRVELEFPPLNSYYRRILHRLSRRYNLAHRVEVTNIFNSASTLRKVYLTKPVGMDLISAAPVLKCCEWIEGAVEYTGDIKLTSIDEKKKESRSPKDFKYPLESKTKTKIESSQEKPKFKILKRQTTDENDSSDGQSSAPVLPLSVGGLSLEEREAEYQAVRDRIFEGFTSTESAQMISESSQSTEPAQTILFKQYPPPTPPLISPLNPDAIPFDFSLTPTPTPTNTVNHIYLISSTTIVPLSHTILTQILSKFPSEAAVVKCRSLPTDSAFLLVKGCEVGVMSDANLEIRKWMPEFYLD